MKFKHPSRKKPLGTDVWCFEADYRDYTPLSLCLDAAQPVIVSAGYEGDRYEFSDFQTLEGQKYPGTIRRFNHNKPVLEVRNLRAQPGPLPQDAFQVPARAREFETCENMVEPKLLSNGNLFPQSTAHSKAIRIFIYGIIAEDGRLSPVQMTSIPRDSTVIKAVQELAAQRRYSPATCEAKPIAIETFIEVENTISR